MVGFRTTLLSLVAAVSANGLLAAPAFAIDCFPKAAAAPAAHAGPRRPVHHVRKATAPRVQKVRAARKANPGVHRIAHVRKPRAAVAIPVAAPRAMMLRPGYTHIADVPPEACDKHPRAMMSLLPGAAPPRGARGILADLAGPPSAVEQGVPVADVVPVTPVVDTGPGLFPDFPLIPGIGQPGLPGLPGLVLPGTPVTPVTPPGTPPVVVGPPGAPPDVTPPIETPPGLPPVLPPLLPPDTPPTVVLPPDTPPGVVIPPPGPGPTGGVPEPATWGMLILGFFGTGAAMRRSQRRSAVRG